mgnify:CR=1 FL=1|tara:strand:- start:202 stop:1098 length:897 start_codon:yes stop_codon:yes gene_type:complete
MSEFEFIEEVTRDCLSHAEVILGPGDDTAILRPQAAQLTTVDMLMDQVHFDLANTKPFRIGRKCLAVNLSDIAAMGGKPTAAVVALGLPKEIPSLGIELYKGIHQLAKEFEVAIVGGDTNIWNGPLTVSITAFGEPHPKGPTLRSGARAGDHIWVSGKLGDSLKGHHLDFTPRIREAQKLLDLVNVHSMIDLSDGLSSDLRHICVASKCGALIEQKKLPFRSSGRDRLHKALNDGEDFELCFTLSTDESTKLHAAKYSEFTEIGRIIDEPHIYLEDSDGQRSLMEKGGWQHQFQQDIT